MPTTGKVKGKLIKVWIDDDPVSLGGSGNKQLAGCQTDYNESFETSELEATCKDDGNFSDAIPDENAGSFDLSLLLKYDATFNEEQLKDIWVSQSICEVTVSTNVVGDPEDIYICFLTSLSKSAPVQGMSTMNTSWKIKGTPIFGTVSA